jgi:hypothetical protein
LISAFPQGFDYIHIDTSNVTEMRENGANKPYFVREVAKDHKFSLTFERNAKEVAESVARLIGIAKMSRSQREKVRGIEIGNEKNLHLLHVIISFFLFVFGIC